MFRLTIAEIAANKRRLMATAVAVILGVAFLAGTLILTDTILGTFDDALAEADAGTDVYVRGASPLDGGFGDDGPTIDAALAGRIAEVDGVEAAAVRVTGYAQVLDHHGRAVGNPNSGVLGMGWSPVDELNPFRLVDGRAPVRQGEVVIDKNSADEASLSVGDTTTVLSTGEPQQATIVGIARFGEADSPGGSAIVLFDSDTAQAVLGEAGQVDGIAVAAEAGMAPETLVAALTPLAGPGNEVLTGDQILAEDQAQIHDDIGAFGTFMTVFAGIALFVGAFIINNTFAILVAQRTRQMALLRAIGASGGQVRRAVLAEAAVVGLVASGVGLAAGFGVARLLQALLAAAGVEIPPGATVISLSTVLVSLAAGLVVTVVSAVLPARRASRVAPVAALRETAVDQSVVSTTRAAFGTALAGLGVGALLVGVESAEPAVVGLGAAGLFAGVTVLGPMLARPVAFALGYPMAKLRGLPGTIAQQNAVRNPKRTARTAASLMIGVGLVTFIAILAASTKASGAGAFRTDYHGTAVIDSGAFDATAGLSPDLAADVRGRPGVRAVAEERLATVEIDGETDDYFRAYDAGTIASLFDLGPVEGDLSQLGADGLAVEAAEGPDAPRLGDTRTITFATGARTFTIRAIFANGGSFLGHQFVDLAAFEANLGTQPDSRIYVDADNLDGLTAAVAPYPTAKVLDTEAFIAQQTGEIDTMLKVVEALLGLAVVIALLGIANTLALSVNERRRELGLLRAVGMSRGQVRASVRWESAIVALFGTASGLGLGVSIGWAMVEALAGEGIDRFVIPAGPLAVITAGAVAAGVAAAVLPARRAARVEVLTALAAS